MEFKGYFASKQWWDVYKNKDGVYIINLDKCADTGTHWVTLFCRNNEIVYFDSFGVENVPK